MVKNKFFELNINVMQIVKNSFIVRRFLFNGLATSYRTSLNSSEFIYRKLMGFSDHFSIFSGVWLNYELYQFDKST